jgi:hypothetical protein
MSDDFDAKIVRIESGSLNSEIENGNKSMRNAVP